MSQKSDTDGQSLSRRQFMTRTAGAAAGVVVGAGFIAIPLSSSPMSARYPVVAENKVDLPSNGKSVVVLGGGLAGLQVGVELAARGFKVTVLEKTGTPGGKLKAWRDKSFGPEDDPLKASEDFAGYVREHGVHAIWGFYNNLREFMNRYGWGLQKTPDDNGMYVFIDRDGTQSEWHISSLPQPYGSVEQQFLMVDIPHVREEDREVLGQFLRKLCTFDISDPQQRAYMDSLTMLDYARECGLPDYLTHSLMDSLVEMAFFDNVENVSALSLGNIFQLVAGSPQDMRIEFYQSPVSETFLQPMVDYIRNKGGQVIYNTELTDIDIDNGEVQSVSTRDIGNASQAVTRCSICGALLGPDGRELTRCPVCGANGDMIKYLSREEQSARQFTADYYVSAMDIPSSRLFYEHNSKAFGGQAYFRKISRLQSVSVFVVDLWYEGTEFWNQAVVHENGQPAMDFYPTGFETIGITINRTLPLHIDGSKTVMINEWKDRNISIIQTQVANAEEYAHLTDAELVALCQRELKMVMPDLPEPSDYTVNRWQHYTAYRVGDMSNRPEIQSPVDNLVFVGDMPFVDHPAVFMEKTNVTAKLATNILLDKIGQSEGRIRILPSGTPGVLVPVLRKMTSVMPA